ncbi:MAG: glycosyltransferase [bacterium]
MDVLFVSRGKRKASPSPIVIAQAESLCNLGIDVQYFSIEGKGILGYLKAVFKLRELLKTKNFDVIHAHYSLSGFVAFVAGAKPLVVSLMGSEVMSSSLQLKVTRFLSNRRWTATIVKSQQMKICLSVQNVEVLPNGVDLRVFSPIDKLSAKLYLGLKTKKRYVLFAANPERKEKNYPLIRDAFKKIKCDNIELIYLKNIAHNLIPYYMNASDVIVLTSLWEGSPNVIKEAMSCNRPIVSTDVGDIKWLFGHEEGQFIASFDENDYAEKLQMALDFSKRFKQTTGRQRIVDLGLSSEIVAQRIFEMYKRVV